MKRKLVTGFIALAGTVGLFLHCSIMEPEQNKTVVFNIFLKTATPSGNHLSKIADAAALDSVRCLIFQNGRQITSALLEKQANGFRAEFTLTPGSGYQVLLYGQKAGNVVYRGNKNDISLIAGKPNTVVLEFFSLNVELLSPLDLSYSNNVQPLLAWISSDTNSIYHLQVSWANNFSLLVLDLDQIAGKSYLVSSPLVDGTYFWRVKVSDSLASETNWSGAWKFVIDMNPPGVPALNSPANNASISENNVSFKWSRVTDASMYQFQLDDDSTFASVDLSKDSLSVPEYYFQGTLPSPSCFWRVRARDIAGNWSAWSTSFKIMLSIIVTPPSQLALTVISDSEVQLHWQDNSLNEEGFIIEKKTKGSELMEIARVAANSTGYRDKSAPAPDEGASLGYRVSAYASTIRSSSETKLLASHIFTYLGQIPSTFSRLTSLAFNAAGDQLAAAGDNNGTHGVKIYESGTWNVQATLSDLTGRNFKVAITLNMLAVGSYDHSIHIYQKNTGMWRHINSLYHTGEVTSIAANPIYPYWASGSADSTVRLWRHPDEYDSPEKILYDHKEYISTVCFSPDGNLLASSGMDGTIRVWQVLDFGFGDWTLIATLYPNLPNMAKAAASLAFSPDNQYLASSGSFGINVWRISDWSYFKLNYPAGDIRYIAFTPDGKYIIGIGYMNLIGIWRLWEAQNIDLYQVVPNDMHYISFIAISADAKYMVMGEDRGLIHLYNPDGKWHWSTD